MRESRQNKKSRAKEKHEAPDKNKSNQVTGINPREKTSIAVSLVHLVKTRDKTQKIQKKKVRRDRNVAAQWGRTKSTLSVSDLQLPYF